MQKSATSIAQSLSAGGLMIIEAQMGTGKTEAALAAAEMMAGAAGCSGVFFGLPTQATSNGIFPRLTQWAESLSAEKQHSIRLVHGMAELNEDYQRFFRGASTTDEDGDSNLIAHEWFGGKKQALLADFVVGTVDTALMAALSQKHVMLRHLGLCGKVVIIDEVHAYDAYMSRFLDRLLNWLGAYRVPVILLSATLPREQKNELLKAYLNPYLKTSAGKPKPMLQLPDTEGYPLITWTEQGKVRAKSIDHAFASSEIQINRLDDADIAADLRERLKDGGCVGIIVNTVKRAQMLAAQMQQEFPAKKVLLYHAQFISDDRIGREKELMDIIGKASDSTTRNNIIVVGTQVLEQSLDIDFDYLITDLCPIDLLLQRIGRLHRHQRVRPAAVQTPCCSVLGSEGELEAGAKMIYGEWLLRQTAHRLPHTICLPTDIPGLVEQVYAATSDDENDTAWESFCYSKDKKRNDAKTWLLKEPRVSRYENRNSLVGMLDRLIENEKHAEASVRDSSPSLEVLVMRRVDEDHLGFMPWNPNAALRCDARPSEEEAQNIARQRLRLPFTLCCGKQLDEIITALESENMSLIPLWQQSPWLKGELILILDKEGAKDLCGYHLTYEKDLGLTYERINENKGD